MLQVIFSGLISPADGTVRGRQVVFLLPHGKASVSASGLHVVAGVVHASAAAGLPFPFLDLDSFGPRVCLDADKVREAVD